MAQRVGGSGTQRQRHRHGAVPGGHSGGWRGGIRRGRRGDESRRDGGCGRRAAVSGVRGGLVPSCLWLRAAPHGAGLEEEGRPHIACRAGGVKGVHCKADGARSTRWAAHVGCALPAEPPQGPPPCVPYFGGITEWCGAEGDLTAP